MIDDYIVWRCKSCGYEFIVLETVAEEYGDPDYCPKCGKKIKALRVIF